MDRLPIYLFHVLFVAPLLIYIGLMGPKDKIPVYVFRALVVLGAVVLSYHGYRAGSILASKK